MYITVSRVCFHCWGGSAFVGYVLYFVLGVVPVVKAKLFVGGNLVLGEYADPKGALRHHDCTSNNKTTNWICADPNAHIRTPVRTRGDRAAESKTRGADK